mmetsp:Transcript_9376/g.34933  ORF Transcript_9376/g.34933 Transcript_9376/m.34933 type:complete len:314 (+) Transcript_9376:25-966(+)|eukprot:CAMPEP_0197117798 /NCGR_PEP_ID=MMETSP1390-20130617/1096_1 /TAXON_ID=38833 /ORGANISM="Micromonas sp., Strain CCMP2099" /LENGTH=313 /DNA_ID=CAMNT_0042559253 /DNA_START=29 /DNA_END=970 /DNA_ORIENTATION=-
MAGKKKNCNCRNSRCLKLYCECFASGLHCNSCNCSNCCNNLENTTVRQEAVEATLERNPNAFRPKIAPIPGAAEDADGAGRHNKGCHCKKSSCLKKYCECFQANIFCADICRCVDCQNFEGSAQRMLTTAKAARNVQLTSTKKGASAGPATGLKSHTSTQIESSEKATHFASVKGKRSVEEVVLAEDVDEVLHSLLTVDADRGPADCPSERAPQRQRWVGNVSTQVKTKNADARMSPATQALLCDESEKLFASTSPRGAEPDKALEGGVKIGDQADTQLTSEIQQENEGPILLGLARQLKIIAARHSRAKTTI